MNTAEIIQAIQYVLAPAVMVSAAGLLILGFQNKSSNIANRFRLLNHEKRLLELKEDRLGHEETRFKSLDEQIDFLVQRAFLIRNAILLGYASVVGFMTTSVLLFANIYCDRNLYPVIIGVFIAALLMLLAACCSMILETLIFYRVIRLEDTV